MIEIGKTYEVVCPFRKASFTQLTEDGYSDEISWVPGAQPENVGPYGDTEYYADGVGAAIFTVIAFSNLPKPYKSRVFFIRKFRRPDGIVFGKRNLHVATIDKFNRLISGWGRSDEEWKLTDAP